MSLSGAPVTADRRIAAPVFSGMRGSKNAIEGMGTGVFTLASLSRPDEDQKRVPARAEPRHAEMWGSPLTEFYPTNGATESGGTFLTVEGGP